MSTYKFLQDSVLFDFFNKSNKITLIKDGQPFEYEQGIPEYDAIMREFQDMIFNAYEMPAFGVCMHEETIEARAQGIWLEFHFPETFYHSDMPFDTLLINIAPEDKGFNLLRQHDGQYEGRCFYLNLIDKDMHSLFELLKKL